MTNPDEFEGFELLASDDSSGSEEEGDVPISEVYQQWTNISMREYGDATVAEYTVNDSAKRYYANNLGHLVSDLKHLRNITGATAINLKARVLNIETHEESIRTLRIGIDDETLDSLPEYIASSAAPMFEGDDKYSGSDNVTGMLVMWDLGWVQMITQLGDTDIITTVVGSSTMFPGYVTKVIDDLNHGIDYSVNDCIFRCLNEALGVANDPLKIRATIYPNVPIDLLGRRLVKVKKDLKPMAKLYMCNITMHSLDDDMRYVTSKDKSLPTVHLIKMGSAIGIREKVVALEQRKCDDTEGDMAYYDLETVSRSSSTNIYAFCLLWPDGTKVTLIHHDKDVMNRSIVSVLSDLLAIYSGKKIYLQAWNGSRFDHLILLGICSKEFKVGFPLTNSRRELLTVSLSREGKSLILRDPCKMFPATLEKAAEVFALEQGKLDIDHREIEEAYLSGHLEQYLEEHRDTIERYIERDVYILKDITLAIVSMYTSSGVVYNSCLSRSMGSYTLWRASMDKSIRSAMKSIQFDHTESLAFSKGPISIEKIRSEAIAGRVQCIRGKYKHTTLLDFKAMYPSVSAQELYPSGNYTSTLKYIPGKLGLYSIKIKSQHHPHVIPYRDKPKDAYDWSYDGKIEKLVTNVDLECLYESGIKPKIRDGIVWDDKADYFSGYMTKMFQLRRDSSGNIALSEHYKAMANSLTGAIFQQLTREYSKVFKDSDEAQRYLKMHRRYIYLVHEAQLEGEQVMMYFFPKKLKNLEEIKVQKEICKGAMGSKPIILTMFIYAYARKRLWDMWRYVENNYIGKVVYCDTDSLLVVANHITKGKLVNVSSRLKEYIGTNMGQIEIVVSNAEAVVAQPKTYATRDREGRERVRLKGISSKGMVMVMSNTISTRKAIVDIKSSKWEIIRNKYYELLEGPQGKICYDIVGELLEGKILVVLYWYFVREDNKVNKKYAVSVLSL